jgi:hypothetical protein
MSSYVIANVCIGDVMADVALLFEKVRLFTAKSNQCPASTFDLLNFLGRPTTDWRLILDL